MLGNCLEIRVAMYQRGIVADGNCRDETVAGRRRHASLSQFAGKDPGLIPKVSTDAQSFQRVEAAKQSVRLFSLSNSAH